MYSNIIYMQIGAIETKMAVMYSTIESVCLFSLSLWLLLLSWVLLFVLFLRLL
eukprot:COSAG05_NODE_1633_length_4368_cov_1.606934_7_plen_53_part_00